MREVMNSTIRITAMTFFIFIVAQILALAAQRGTGLHAVRCVAGRVQDGPHLHDADAFHPWLLPRMDRDLLYRAAAVLSLFRQSRRRPGLAGDFCRHQPIDVVLDSALWLRTVFFKGVRPPGFTTVDIHKSVIPFFGMQFAIVAILFYYPELATWLPKAIRW